MSSTIFSSIIAAAISLSIVFLGRRSETIKQLQSIRAAAYADFVRGVAGLGVIQSKPVRSGEDFVKEQEFMILIAEAKARIAIYGSKSVVHSMALSSWWSCFGLTGKNGSVRRPLPRNEARWAQW
jgi:hypothetical protein